MNKTREDFEDSLQEVIDMADWSNGSGSDGWVKCSFRDFDDAEKAVRLAKRYGLRVFDADFYLAFKYAGYKKYEPKIDLSEVYGDADNVIIYWDKKDFVDDLKTWIAETNDELEIEYLKKTLGYANSYKKGAFVYFSTSYGFDFYTEDELNSLKRVHSTYDNDKKYSCCLMKSYEFGFNEDDCEELD